MRQRACEVVDRGQLVRVEPLQDRKSTRLNSSHQIISYAVFCLKKKKKESLMPYGSHIELFYFVFSIVFNLICDSYGSTLHCVSYTRYARLWHTLFVLACFPAV